MKKNENIVFNLEDFSHLPWRGKDTDALREKGRPPCSPFQHQLRTMSQNFYLRSLLR